MGFPFHKAFFLKKICRSIISAFSFFLGSAVVPQSCTGPYVSYDTHLPVECLTDYYFFPSTKTFFFVSRKLYNPYTRIIFSSSDFFRNTCFPFELAHFPGRLLGPTRAYYVLLFPSDKPMQARNKQQLQRSNKPQYKKKTNKNNKIHLI